MSPYNLPLFKRNYNSCQGSLLSYCFFPSFCYPMRISGICIHSFHRNRLLSSCSSLLCQGNYWFTCLFYLYCFVIAIIFFLNRSLGTFFHIFRIPFPNSGIEIIPLVNYSLLIKFLVALCINQRLPPRMYYQNCLWFQAINISNWKRLIII